jgi:hypothetical protein
MADNARKLIAATFETPDGGSRAAGAIGGSMPDKIGNTAVLFVKPDGKAKFVESKDWAAAARCSAARSGSSAVRSEYWRAGRSARSPRSSGTQGSRTTSSSSSARR